MCLHEKKRKTRALIPVNNTCKIVGFRKQADFSTSTSDNVEHFSDVNI